MIKTGAATSLDIDEAAAFLGLHPSTLQERARAGAIPGAKIGKEWRFLDVDLAAYLRAQYPANQTQKPGKSCHFTVEAKSGGSASRTRASGLDDLLGLPTAKPRSASTTKSKPNSGRVVALSTHSRTPPPPG